MATIIPMPTRAPDGSLVRQPAVFLDTAQTPAPATPPDPVPTGWQEVASTAGMWGIGGIAAGLVLGAIMKR